MLQNQQTALFNHAARIYGLNDNPCFKVKRMGKADADRRQLQFWTIDEFDQFVTIFESGSPKTDESVRTVVIPKFLVEEIRVYVNTFYSIPADERIFQIVPEAV